MKKRTKIVATISDLNCDVEFLQDMYNSGVNVMRINTAHQTPNSALKVVDNIRKVSDKIAIIVDTKGPEVRTKNINDPINVKRGDKLLITNGQVENLKNKYFSVSYDRFIEDVPKGSKVFIDDGELQIIVRNKKDNTLICEVLEDGIIKNNKSINVPNVHLKYPTLIKKDIEFINFAAKNDIEFIAHSFVRNKKDVMEVQNIINKNNSKLKIIAKIENEEGVNNIDEILEHVYGIMVARGDLAVEVSAEKIPLIQKTLIRKCIEKRKPVIVATQMLHSMIDNPRPTRAEISDVANAILDGTDAIMLSGETAYGKHPLKAVKMMNNIALEIEKNIEHQDEKVSELNDDKTISFLTHTAIDASKKLSVKAIITDTASGRTARHIAAHRSNRLIFTQCYDKRVMRELALSYGIYAEYYKPKDNKNMKHISDLINKKIKERSINKEDKIVVLAGHFGEKHGASFLEVSSAKNLVKLTSN